MTWLPCRHSNGEAPVALVAILISLDIKRQMQCADSWYGIIKQAAFARLGTSTCVARNELHTMGCNTKHELVAIDNSEMLRVNT